MQESETQSEKKNVFNWNFERNWGDKKNYTN